MLGVEPPTSGLWGQNSTTTPTWQVKLKGVKVCAHQKHDQSFAIRQWAMDLVNLEKRGVLVVTFWAGYFSE